MASKKLIERLCAGFKLHPKEEEMLHALQDLTDQKVVDAVLRYRPADFYDLANHLADEYEENKEIESHLLGFDSWEQRQEVIRETNELIERIYQ